jgi:hypothetical protein
VEEQETTVTDVVKIDGEALYRVVEERGLAIGSHTMESGPVSSSSAIYACAENPGDYAFATCIDVFLSGPESLDHRLQFKSQGISEIADALREGVTVTDADMEEALGPQWRRIEAWVRDLVQYGPSSPRVGEGTAWPSSGTLCWLFDHTVQEYGLRHNLDWMFLSRFPAGIEDEFSVDDDETIAQISKLRDARFELAALREESLR